MGSERDQTNLTTSETSSFIKALSNSIFSKRNIREKRLNPAYCISPNVNVLVVVVYAEGPHGVGGFSDPAWSASAPFSQPPLPACCSEGLSGPYSQETGRADALNSPCSHVTSFPAVTHPRNLLSPSSHIRQLPASGHQSNASAFPCPCTIVSSVPEDPGTRITFKWSLVQNQRRGLQRTASMGTTPGYRRLGAASRRGTKVTARDRGRQVFLTVTFWNLQ